MIEGSTERKQICSVNYIVMIKMRKGKNVKRKINYLKSRETIYKISTEEKIGKIYNAGNILHAVHYARKIKVLQGL